MFPLKSNCWSGLVLASSIGVSTLVASAAEPPVLDALYRPQEAPVQTMRLPSRGQAPIEYAIIREPESRPAAESNRQRGASPFRVQTATMRRTIRFTASEPTLSPASHPIMPLFAE